MGKNRFWPGTAYGFGNGFWIRAMFPANEVPAAELPYPTLLLVLELLLGSPKFGYAWERPWLREPPFMFGGPNLLCPRRPRLAEGNWPRLGEGNGPRLLVEGRGPGMLLEDIIPELLLEYKPKLGFEGSGPRLAMGSQPG